MDNQFGPVWKCLWLEEVAAEPAYTDFTTRVAVAIQAHVNRQTGVTWVSSVKLAADLDATRQGVNGAANALEAGGHLKITRHGRGRGKRNEFQPLLKGNGGFLLNRKKETPVVEKGNGGLHEPVKEPVKEPVGAGGGVALTAAAPPPALADAVFSAMENAGLGTWADAVTLRQNCEPGALEIVAPSRLIADKIKGKLDQVQAAFKKSARESVSLSVVNAGFGGKPHEGQDP